MTDADIEQISIGILIGAGLIVWLLISAALSDRRRHDEKRDDKPKPKD